MKCLTIKQPWASLIMAGMKTIEVRTWTTKHRGPLAIHAGKELDHTGPWYLLPHIPEEPGIPTSYVLGTVQLVDCRPMRPEDAEAARFDYTEGLVAWVLEKPRKLKEPFWQKGKLGLYTIEMQPA